MRAADPRVLAKGPVINRAEALELVKPIVVSDIDEALGSLGLDKAPWCDGFNVKFFRASWSVVKDDIYDAVLNFFEGKAQLNSWNKTLITLIPKSRHANQVKDFRPISCCSVVYKLVAKILAARLQRVIHRIVSKSQIGFIPGRIMLC